MKNIVIKYLIALFSLLSLPALAQFEFGEITGDNCANQACLINFKNSYSEAPVVILMSSIDPEDPKGDRPSAALVESVTNSSALVRQNNIYSSGSETMDPIYYLVAEPGRVVLDPSQPDQEIEVGKLTTNNFQRQGNRSGESWATHSFGVDFGSQVPVVLSQIQPDAGRNYFVTAAIQNVTSDRFSYALEFGRRSLPANAVQRTRTYGYIAAPTFSGTTEDGFDFEFGRPSRGYNQNGDGSRDYERSCEDNEVIFSRSYKHYAPIVRKQVRAGGDGGWIRLCEVTKNDRVTLILEEDASNRSHPVVERVAYAVFDQELSRSRDVCEVFTGPAQSWTNQSELEMTGAAQIIGANNAEVGFGTVDSYVNPPTSCDSATCTPNSNLIIPRPPSDFLVPFGPSQRYSGSGSFDLPEGSYTRITIGGNVTVNFTGSDYQIGELDISGSATVNFTDGTLLVVNELEIGGNLSITVPGNNPGNLVIWSIPSERGGNASVEIGSGINLYAYIYSAEDVELSGSSHIFGAVTTKDLEMKGSARITHTQGECLPDIGDVTLSVTPSSQIALMCGDNSPKIAVTTSNGTGGIAQNLTLEFVDPADENKFSVTLNGVDAYPNFSTNNSGFAELTVTVDNIDAIDLDRDYQISIRLDSDATQSETVTFKFSPFTFQASDNIIDVIAGKPKFVTTKVLACDSNNAQQIATNYQGTPLITHSIDKPLAGVKGNLTYAPEFVLTENGQSTDELTISESGEFTITLEDSFECSGYSGCPSDNQYRVQGSFTVKSRPWTFAICPSSDAGGDSTSGSGFVPAREAFALNAKPVVWSSSLSGNASDGTALRLRQKEASSNAFCSLSTTSNFYINDSETNVAASLSHSLATPTAGIAGTMSYDGPVDNHSSSSELPFTGISVTEVGSFHFAVDASNSFYNAIEGGIETGARELGRFYPRYFRAVGEDWDYFGGQNFNYMNQNFEQVSFDVEALSGGTTPQAVENYQHFAPAMQARFNLYDDDQPERLIFPDFGAATWQGTNQSIGRFSALPSGHCSDSNLTSLCWVKADTAIGYEDGPFNLNGTTTNPTDIRLTLESGPDPVEYWDSGELLTTQPDLRFGRVALDSLGSTVNTTLNIPLRVEFWNGERFVVNSDDDAVYTILGESTSTNNNNIWVEEGQTAETLSFDNGGLVNDGESDSITVTHSSQVRQQTQIWLELDNTDNDMPWLRYNWDDDLASDDANGEQDPSSVVTFGIYRGNDRVIFRGEPGLIGQ